MCRGSEAAAAAQDNVETPSKCSELQTLQEADENEDPGPLTPGSASSDLAPLPDTDAHPQSLSFDSEETLACPQSLPFDSEETLAWSPPLPVRALQARLQPLAAPPRWAAWLPPRVQQASYGGVQGQMPDASTQAVSCQDAPQFMSADVYGNQIDMGQQWVTPDGLILQPVVFYTGADGDGQNWPNANSEWPAAECYQNSGMQFEQEYAQLNPLPQDTCSIGPFAGRVWKLSQDHKGCRQVQDAFEACNEQERIALASELKGHVWQALKCGNANHVIQKCVNNMQPASVQFIIDELTHHGTGGAAHAARHRFGCRIMERLLEHCSAEQLAPMVEELLAECAVLSTHIYGYYVVQHLLEHLGEEVAARINASLEQNLSMMPPDGYAGAVIGTALSKGSNPGAQSLAKALLKEPEYAATMACSRWGHAAVSHALKLVDESVRDKACEDIKYYSGWLRSNRYGRLVATDIAEHQNMPINSIRKPINSIRKPCRRIDNMPMMQANRGPKAFVAGHCSSGEAENYQCHSIAVPCA